MQDHKNADTIGLKRVPWNKGKLIGAKPPLWPKYVWSIRTKLQVEGRTRDLAMCKSRHRSLLWWRSGGLDPPIIRRLSPFAITNLRA